MVLFYAWVEYRSPNLQERRSPILQLVNKYHIAVVYETYNQAIAID